MGGLAEEQPAHLGWFSQRLRTSPAQGGRIKSKSEQWEEWTILQHSEIREQCCWLTSADNRAQAKTGRCFYHYSVTEMLSRWKTPGQKARLPSPSASSCGEPGLEERLWRMMLPCCSLHAGVCTHRVAQGHGLSLSRLVVMSLGVAWCKEVSADIGGKKRVGEEDSKRFL